MMLPIRDIVPGFKRSSSRGSGQLARGVRGVGVSLALALAPACARRGEVPTVTPRPLGRDFPVYRPTADGAQRIASPGSAGDSLTLRDALSRALLQSPALAAFAWEVRARDARVDQAGRLVNPVLGYLAEDLGVDRADGNIRQQPVQRQATLELSQLVELGGKRLARQRLASRERELAQWDYETARMDVLTSVTHAFVDVLVAQRMVLLTRRTTDLIALVEQSVTARVAAGDVSPIEETRARVAVAGARVQSERAQRQLVSSRSQLSTLWGDAATTLPSATGNLDEIRELPPFEVLRAGLSQNSDVARWATEIARREAAVTLEARRRLPDVTVNAGFRRFNDLQLSAYIIGISLPLPVFDWNRGAVNEARSLLGKSREEQRAAQARVAAALADAYRALSSARDEVVALRQTMLPGARETFELVTEGYRLGRFSYLEVLDAQRTLVAAEEQHLTALSNYHKAVATVERLIGTPLTEVLNAPR